MSTTIRRPDDPLAQALGWFSLALGAPQVAVPGRLVRAIGLRDGDRSRAVCLAVGARELLAAGAILSRPRPARWLWARVGGDVLDLALLGAGLRSAERPARTFGAIGAVAGVTAADVVAAVRAGRAPEPEARAVLTVARPQDEVTRAWSERRSEEMREAAATFAAAPGGRGTEITVIVKGGGPVAKARAKAELRRFKQAMETGTIVRSEGSPEGSTAGRQLKQRPARPVEVAS